MSNPRSGNPILGLPPRITCEERLGAVPGLVVGQFLIEPAVGAAFRVLAAIDTDDRHLQVRPAGPGPFDAFQREFLKIWGGALVDLMLEVPPAQWGRCRVISRTAEKGS